MSQILNEELKHVFDPAVANKIIRETAKKEKATERIIERKGLNNVFEMFKELDCHQGPFSVGNDVLEDLHLWSEKINILGFVITSLAAREREDGDHSFFHFGEVLGDIIEEYSKAINCVVNNEKFRDHFLRRD